MSDRAKLLKLPRSEAKRQKVMAAAMMKPAPTHGTIAFGLLKPLSGGELDQGEFTLELHDRLKAVREGKLDSLYDLLTAQAFSLDATYLEMMRRAMLNFGEYPDAVERYMRLALKAQAQSRATLEALAKLHQPREQTVRHVHVNEGGQAIVADQFHHHAGGIENAENEEQCHATVTVD